MEGLRNRTANAWGIQFTRRSVSRSEVLPLRGDGGQCADHGQLILVRSMIAVRKGCEDWSGHEERRNQDTLSKYGPSHALSMDSG